MKRAAWAGRIAAVVCAVALVSIYVYDRAGGNILPKWGSQKRAGDETGRTNNSPGNEGEFMYSSKSGRISLPPPNGDAHQVEIPDESSRPHLLPGSKSAPVPLFNGPTEQSQQQTGSQPSNGRNTNP